MLAPNVELGTRAEVKEMRGKRICVFQQCTKEAVPGSNEAELGSSFNGKYWMDSVFGHCENSMQSTSKHETEQMSKCVTTVCNWPQESHRMLPFGWVKAKQCSWNLECLSQQWSETGQWIQME